MLNQFIIILLVIIMTIYILFNQKKKVNTKIDEKFNQIEDECWMYGDDYNSCYSAPNCTIGFLPDGSTHCMKKFLQEDI